MDREEKWISLTLTAIIFSRLTEENLAKEVNIPYAMTGGLFLAAPGRSVVPEMNGKAVYQFNYRFALACTAFVEAMSSWMNLRSNTLEAGLKELLDGKLEANKPFVDDFYVHPLVQALSKQN